MTAKREAWGRRTQSLHEPIERHAAANPQATALLFRDVRLTYGELDGRANRAARYLSRRGVGRGDVVGICLDRSLETVVAMLAVLKCGATCLPLDPAYPRDRLSTMVTHARTSAVITRMAHLEQLPAMESPVIDLDGEASAIASESDAPVGVAVEAHQIALVIYTSGSTGRPKGVQLSHGALHSYVTSMAAHLEIAPSDVALQTASISFAASLRHLYAPLFSGAAVAIAAPEHFSNVLALLQYVAAHDVSILNMVPSHLQACVDALEELDEAARRALLANGVRLVATGGEALQLKTVKQWAAFRHPAKVVNLYGQTETCMVSSYTIDLTTLDRESAIPIGKAIDNAAVYVLTDSREIAPAGEIGTIYVGGESLATGYLDEPKLTSELFTPDPFCARPGARLYRTGDRGRVRADGSIEYVGRADDEVKVRGFRVAPGEIKNVLMRCAGVRDAVVVAQKERDANRLHSYVVVMPDARASASALREALRRTVPEYMVPSSFTFVESIPLGPNGKVDKLGLLSRWPPQAERTTDFVAPRNAIENTVREIWQQALDIDGDIGVNDAFAEIGGDSLAAMRVFARVESVFGFMPPVTIFEMPTIAGLAEAIQKHSAMGDELHRPRIVRSEPAVRVASAMQERTVRLIDKQGMPFYRMAFPVLLRGALDVGALREALAEVCKRHEMLRATFDWVDDRLVPTISPAQENDLPVVDLTHLAEDARTAEVDRRIQAAQATSYNLRTDPPVALELFRLAPEKHVLIISLGRLSGDASSARIVYGEMMTLYGEVLSASKDSALPPPAFRYTDYANWEKSSLDPRRLQSQEEFWRQQFAAPLLRLPFGASVAARQLKRRHTASLALSDVATSLRRVCQRERTSVPIFLLSALSAVFSADTGQDDLSLALMYANRDRAELQSLVGPCLRVPLLRIRLDGIRDFSETLQRVRRSVIDATSNAEYLPLLQTMHPADFPVSRPPSVIFDVQQPVTMSTAGVTLTEYQPAPKGDVAQFGACDLLVRWKEEDGLLNARLIYDPCVFDAAMMDRLCGAYRKTIVSLIGSVEQPMTGSSAMA